MAETTRHNTERRKPKTINQNSGKVNKHKNENSSKEQKKVKETSFRNRIKKRIKGLTNVTSNLFTLESKRCMKKCLKKKYSQLIVKKDKRSLKNEMKNTMKNKIQNLKNSANTIGCPCSLIRYRTMKRQKTYYHCCEHYDKDPSKCKMILKWKSRRKRKCEKLKGKLSKIKDMEFVKTFKNHYENKVKKEYEHKKKMNNEQNEIDRPKNEDYIKRYYHCCKKENRTFLNRGKCDTFSNMCVLSGRRRFNKLIEIPYYKKYYEHYKKSNL